MVQALISTLEEETHKLFSKPRIWIVLALKSAHYIQVHNHLFKIISILYAADKLKSLNITSTNNSYTLLNFLKLTY